MNYLDWFSDTRNLLTIIALIFCVSIGLGYFFSDTADTYPTLIKFSLGTVIGAGIFVYALMMVNTGDKEKKIRIRR